MKKILLLKLIFLILFLNSFIFTFPLSAKGGIFEIGRFLEHFNWVEICGVLEQFNWKEFHLNGTLELEESGLRKGVNIAYWNKEGLTYAFMDFSIYGGTVDSDGKILLLNLPEGTQLYPEDASYFGIKGKAGIELSKDITLLYIPVTTKPYLCLGLDYWSKTRSLILSISTVKDGEESIINIDTGNYEEKWTILFWKIGLKSEIELFLMRLIVNLWAGSDFFSKNRIDVSNLLDYLNTYNSVTTNDYSITIETFQIAPETIELKPNGSFFYGIDLTLKYSNFFVKGYYKHYRWNKSPEEKIYVEYEYSLWMKTDTGTGTTVEEKYSGNVELFQPESEESDYGIVIGFVF